MNIEAVKIAENGQSRVSNQFDHIRQQKNRNEKFLNRII